MAKNNEFNKNTRVIYVLKIKYSINIATLNEEKDILKNLDNIAKWKRNDFEVNIIDGDSKDNTLKLILDRNYKFNLRIFVNKGTGDLNTDRNIGIDIARGEFVAIITADTVLPVNYLEKMDEYVAQGYDMMLPVDATPSNTNYWGGAWNYAEHHYLYDSTAGTDKFLWAEGTMLRTEIARKIKFPYINKNASGEDGWFGKKIFDSGAKIAWTTGTGVSHIAPSSFPEFWSQRKARSRGTVFMQYYVYHWSKSKVVFSALLRMTANLAMFLLQFPSLITTWKFFQKAHERSLKVFAWLFYANQVDLLGRFWGKKEGIQAILKQTQDYRPEPKVVQVK